MYSETSYSQAVYSGGCESSTQACVANQQFSWEYGQGGCFNHITTLLTFPVVAGSEYWILERPVHWNDLYFESLYPGDFTMELSFPGDGECPPEPPCSSSDDPVTCPDPIQVQCGDAIPAPDSTGLIINQPACCGTPTSTSSVDSGTDAECPIVEVITRTWTVTDRFVHHKPPE